MGTTTTGAPPGTALTWSLRGRGPDDLPVVADPAVPDGPAEGPGAACGSASSTPAWSGTIRWSGRSCGSWVVVKDEATGEAEVLPTTTGDTCGHGTACGHHPPHRAGVRDHQRPGARRAVLRHRGRAPRPSLRWAVDQGFDLINLSLSTTRTRFAHHLHELADRAYFARTVLVASAHNTPVESFPWRFASVLSVGSHQEDDPVHLYNPSPPVEFFAPGQNVTVPWLGGATIRTTGNSFATPYITGLSARLLSARPRMTPFQLKSALYLSAANVTLAPRHHLPAGEASDDSEN